MKKFIVTAIAFIFAPLVLSIGLALFGILSSSARETHDVLMSIMGIYVYSMLFAIFIGIPTLFIVCFFWKITCYTAVIGGFVDGIIAGISFFPLTVMYADDILRFGIYGAISGFVFWLIWKRGSPIT